MKDELKLDFTFCHKANETFRPPADVPGLEGGLLSGFEVPHPRPSRMATDTTPPHLIPASAGGKLQEKIGVVPPVSATTLVLNYLNGPLPPLCALTPGRMGLSELFSHFLFFYYFFLTLMGISYSMSLVKCLLH